ncbi:response regulator [Citreimonas salinaria]|uniref:Response regulator receiver domain-containing protein n=1 Tax=Citreimonas salinaria TaxID=321339 RepID=A0A1H3HL54_9RHOB|nr:response regulator [Citreimonas salinaria]SDY16187.1 Response regulator receiver domain-containing protein [Citreimonas salinaria]
MHTVLIAESDRRLADLWRRHMERMGFEVRIAQTGEQAIDVISVCDVRVIVLDLELDDGGAMSVSDYAAVRRPEARVIFVTSSSFFSDGSIFRMSANACAFLPSGTEPEDLAAMVDHYGQRHGAPT